MSDNCVANTRLSDVETSFVSTRVTIDLSGTWEVADGISDHLPEHYCSTLRVPGLVSQASPSFLEVGKFKDGRVMDFIRTVQGRYDGTPTPDEVGHNRQWYWLKRTLPRLPVGKRIWLFLPQAQYGANILVNDHLVGETLDPYGSSLHEVTPFLRGDGTDNLVIRLGALPCQLPRSVCGGSDVEKLTWFAGLPDAPVLWCCGGPVIRDVQVAPDPTLDGIRVGINLEHPLLEALEIDLVVHDDQGKHFGSARIALNEGERSAVAWVDTPDAPRWSLESPVLLQLEVSHDEDSCITRFGLRSFENDTACKRFRLNGEVVFLRGTNICLQRFLDDPASAALAWDREWVRKFLCMLKGRFHINALRIHLSVASQLWHDVCDEFGILVMIEYPIWIWLKGWDPETVAIQQERWVRDHVNHPSIVIWSACNETVSIELTNHIVPKARMADMSGRPWDNGYNLPGTPTDIVSQHPYFVTSLKKGGNFHHRDLMLLNGGKRSVMMPHPYSSGDYLLQPHSTAHTAINNEFGFYWLDPVSGLPTHCNRAIWERLLPNANGSERLAAQARWLAMECEYWRAYRQWAGVMHFTFLTGNAPNQATRDHFLSYEQLSLEPFAAQYLEEALKPLGVFINYTDDTIEAGPQRFAVMLVNDLNWPLNGALQLSLHSGSETNEPHSRAELDFVLPALGSHTVLANLDLPAQEGDLWLIASANAGLPEGPTRCKRVLRIAESSLCRTPLIRAEGDAFN